MSVERKRHEKAVRARLKDHPVVCILGPRQCGKTTLAREISGSVKGKVHYFDLESAVSAKRLQAPETALGPLRGLVVIDEVQRMPELFPLLRVLADRKPVRARFLLLGSASPELVSGASESLAGRVAFVEMGGFDMGELGLAPGAAELEVAKLRRLWTRGGFPRSYLARSEASSMEWRRGFVRTFLERDLPSLGLRVPAATLERFWTMVAHYHGNVWNSAEFARSLGSAENTARRYLDLLCGTFLVRQLPPWYENVKKRQVKAPKVYVRDSGMLHTLLELERFRDVERHPKLGGSWEGFALEQVLAAAGDRQAYFWATHGGAEVDLMLIRRGKRYGFEFKYSDAPSSTKSMHIAQETLGLAGLYVIYPGRENYPVGKDMAAIGIGGVKALGEAVAAGKSVKKILENRQSD